MTISCKQKFFLGATEAAVAIMTIGPELEQEVSRLNNCGELLSGLALDACGSVAIDEVLERFRGFLATEVAKRQRVLGHNLSPGGQFVPIEVQAVLFTMLEAEKVEVTLNDSYLMIPIKSETMIIPLGEQLEMIDKSTILSCDLCPGKNTCTHRRQKLSDFGGSGHTESKLGIEQLDHTGTFEGHDSCNNNCGQSCNCEH